MSMIYLTSQRIKHDTRTIRERFKDCVLLRPSVFRGGQRKFVNYYNHERHHKSSNKPSNKPSTADVFYSGGNVVLEQRKQIRQTAMATPGNMLYDKQTMQSTLIS